ncbi:hypothetical protein [Leeuwenhoekiella sp. H156]|uniref:hypothetical protein n=1 Tax=Leeuwenhoekiella sp. H156 TaxID=3450128 RepID=UPI003FA48B56
MKKSIYFFAAAFFPFTVIGQTLTNYGTNSGTLGSFSAYYGGAAGSITQSEASSNTFIGFEAGKQNTTGSNNTFIGKSSGYGFGTGDNNVFIGHQTGQQANAALNNTAVGNGSGFRLTGADNTFLGYRSGFYTTTGSSNILLGFASGLNNITGSDNVYIGLRAGHDNTQGSRNVLLGRNAAYKNTSGSNSVMLGYQAGYNNQGSGNVFIGFEAGLNEAGSSSLYIENSRNEIPLIYGEFAANVVGINTKQIPSGYTFAVKGKAIAEEVKVQLQSAWPDYVFDRDYNLMTLKEIETYIEANNHLPEVPSQSEVKNANGIELGTMNALLLRKIEELTLYAIEQDNQLEVRASREQELTSRLTEQEKLLNGLLKRLEILEKQQVIYVTVIK